MSEGDMKTASELWMLGSDVPINAAIECARVACSKGDRPGARQMLSLAISLIRRRIHTVPRVFVLPGLAFDDWREQQNRVIGYLIAAGRRLASSPPKASPETTQ